MYTKANRSDSNRTKNTIRNIQFGIINRIVLLLLQFVIRTILIHIMGTEYAGLSSLFTSVIQVLNVTELGLSSALLFSMYEPVAQNNVTEICEQICIIKYVNRVIGVLFLFLGLLILPFINYFVKGDCPDGLNLYILFLIYLSNSVIGYFMYGYKNSILIAYQRQDIVKNIESVVSIIQGFLQIGILYFTRNYYLFILVTIIGTVVINLLAKIEVKRLFPYLSETKSFRKDKLIGMSKQIKGAAIGKISLVCRNAFDSIIISSLFGLKLTAIYSNYYYLFSAVMAIISILLVAMSSSVGNSIAMESRKKNAEDHLRFDFYYEVIVGVCTVCMVVLYQPFMRLWVGEELLFPMDTMLLFCIYFYVNNLAQVRSVYSEASGLWWEFRYITIAEMVTNLALNFGLGFLLGVNGVLIATIITAFFSSFIGITLLVYKKMFDESPKQYYINNLVYFVLTVILISVIYRILSAIDINTWLKFCGVGVTCVVCSLVSFVSIYGCIGKYRKYIVQVLKKRKKENLR